MGHRFAAGRLARRGKGGMLAQHKTRDVQRTTDHHLTTVGYAVGFAVVAALWVYIVFWL